MIQSYEGLENQLGPVHKGDLIYLETRSGDGIAGFVKNVSVAEVELSHEAPHNRCVYATSQFPQITKGDRKYPLSDFVRYEVLKKYQE